MAISAYVVTVFGRDNTEYTYGVFSSRMAASVFALDECKVDNYKIRELITVDRLGNTYDLSETTDKGNKNER